jgi:hypothetical protein
MDSPLLLGALLAIALTVSYYSWHKERDRIELYYIWIYGVGILALLWQSIASIFLHLSGSVQSINHYFLFAFWLAEAVAWLSLTVQYYMRKRR